MISKSLRRCLITAVLLMVSLTLVQAQPKVEDVQSFTLKNGMKMFVLEDHSIPNANMYLLYKVGSRNEYPGITGLSHFFEHMMFNGAKKYGPKEFDRVMEANGGANNASTSENLTVYTDWFPAESLEVIFQLEADRIKDLALDEKMVESERGVIISERLTGLENSPFSFLYEQVKGTAFFAHPYRWEVVGYESDIKNWKRSDLQNYFNTYYAPNNVVVVVAGAVKTADVKKMAEKYFEPIPGNTPPRPVHTVEPEQLGEKRLYVKKDVSSPHVMIVYHAPSSSAPDFYTVKTLESILGQGESSRLFKTLVEDKQLAQDLFTFFPESIDPHLFHIYAICSKGVTEDAVEKAIYEELDKIIKEGVTEQELQKVKNRELMNFYNSLQTINGKANNIGTYEIFFGSYKKLFEAPDEYRKVTVDDIKRAAATYFKPSNRTVGILKKAEENK